MTGCSNTRTTLFSSSHNSESRTVKSHNKPTAMTEEDLLFSLLRSEYAYWKGAPYRLGGVSKRGVDCSALVQAIYKTALK